LFLGPLVLKGHEQFTHPESGTCRDLFDCGEVPVTAEGHRSRLIVATHQATTSPIGVIRDQRVYELFFTALPALGFTAADVVKLYLHRGSFETVLADEDREQDSDRWSSYVRRFGIHEIALKEGRREKAKHLLRHLTYLEPKGKGESSMSGKRLNKKVCIVTRRKSCPQEVSLRERG
jgi:hypothetical protein